jgi:pyruvate dehydrogenase E1 component beta subunit
MPSTPYDAKGLMVAAIKDDNPVIYMDDRWLYNLEGEVPKETYSVAIGKGIIRRKGKDVTLVATSFMVLESVKAAEDLERDGVDVEVIDLRSVKPLDETLLFESLRKTGRLVVADGGWKTCGLAAEVSARVSETIFESLKAPIVRVTLPDSPAPASCTLEKEYYPTSKKIAHAVKSILSRGGPL